MIQRLTVLFLTMAIADFDLSAGERLPNGIVLPETWPPTIDALNPGPIKPPYLKSRNIPRPLSIDLGRQLFVDDFLISSMTGMVRSFFKPVKYEGNPVLWPETKEELALTTELGDRPYSEKDGRSEHWNPRLKTAPACCLSGGGVWWDASRRKFRMWYLAGWCGLPAIAESDDGLHWVRPNVGPRGTNVLMYPEHTFDTFSVWPDYGAADPYARWNLYVSPGENPCRAYEYVSSDGIGWELKTRTGLNGDSSTLFYNPFRGKWVWSIRAAWRRRSRIYHEHADFLEGAKWDFGKDVAERKTGADPAFYIPGGYHDTKDCVLWLACDEDDIKRTIDGKARRCELYNVDATPYESIMVGLFKIISGRDNAESAGAGMPKTTTLHFAYSRDGFHFTRPDRTPAIPDSDWGSGSWDSGYLGAASSGFVIKDERLLFFYTGVRGDASERTGGVCTLANGMHANMSIGVASLRRDGFVGMTADGMGELTTRPVLFAGKRLFVNVDARFGSCAAEIVGEDGSAIDGFSFSDCKAIVREDTTKRELAFKGGDLSALAGKAVRIRFRLRVATLFSFWVSKDAGGTSGGYLAAGGPDYAGFRDL